MEFIKTTGKQYTELWELIDAKSTYWYYEESSNGEHCVTLDDLYDILENVIVRDNENIKK